VVAGGNIIEGRQRVRLKNAKKGGLIMPRYLSLLTFTEQGVRDVQQTVPRAKAFEREVQSAGGKVIVQYWATGEVDGCVVFEAPTPDAATSLLLALGKKGNVRTRTLEVYNADEMQAIVQKM
jgi:uncharacterized protein with GYD domain